jgi:hypothetical protein
VLKRYVHLEPPGAIREKQSDQVRKAVSRMAQLSGMGHPRPARRLRRNDNHGRTI